MTDDAADDDDERLKSLRAVWLSMPDEEPPERGLADLMAAARMKAEQMADQVAEKAVASAEPAAPSLWQRFLDLMRRPPVLALATVMVLIGGAVLVGRRGDKMESAPTVAPTQSAPEGASTGASPPAAAEIERADNAAPPAEPAPASAAGSAMTTASEAGADDRKAPAPKHGVAPTREANKVQTAAPVEEKQEPVRTAPVADDLLDQTATLDDGDRETEADSNRKRGATVAAPKEDSAIGGASAAPQTQTKPAPFSASQLHAVARKEAARKDCAAARQLVQKIASVDPAYYKSKVVHDPALAVCTNSN